jgi:uncharacterized protein YecT (DUF1311 family)
MRMNFPQRFVLVVLCATGMFTTALAASSSPPSVDDCDDYYYGIHQAPDLSKALKCYQDEKRWDLLIVMHLNGEGTPMNVQKAEELLQAWQKDEPTQTASLQAQALRKVIDERKEHPGVPYPRIDFCKDIAGDTLALNFCVALSAEIEEVKLGTKLAKIRLKLTPAAAALFDKVTKEFYLFEGAEANRGHQRYIGGTCRIIASSGQAAFVRYQFSAFIEKIVERRNLEPANQEAYEAADRELNQVYYDDIADYVKDYEEQILNLQDEDDVGRYRMFIDDYKKDSKEAQIHWIRYRDLCAELARSLYKRQKAGFDPALSMKTALTRIRVIELRHDPMGPGPGE